MADSASRVALVFMITILLLVFYVKSEEIIPVPETNSVILSCVVHDFSVNGKKVRWYKGTELVSLDRQVIRYKTILNVIRPPPPNEWNLQIRRVTKEFEDEYTCKVNGVPVRSVRVVVESSPEIVDSASSPMSVIQHEFTDVTLRCEVVGYPKARITWSRKSRGQGGSIDDLGISTSEMTIQNATRYADDIYICLAENKHGSTQREMSVRILFPPEVTMFRTEGEAKKGDQVMMACVVQSSPLHDAFWRNENGLRLSTNFKHIVDVENEPVYPVRYLTLTLRKDAWEEADYGQYSCNVSNGTVTSVKQFTLKRPIPSDDFEETVIKYDTR